MLASAIFVFGLITTLFLIIDAATGGKPRINNGDKLKYGSWEYVDLFLSTGLVSNTLQP